MTASLPAEEEALAIQTIEMFEVVTQSNPLDSESLEILKEAYFKLNRQKEAVATAKRIADAYVQTGKLSSAILEYESILQSAPEDPEVRNALASIENRTISLSNPPPEPKPEPPPTLEPESIPSVESRADSGVVSALKDLDDGRAAMRKVFVDGKHIAPNDFDTHWTSTDPAETPKEPGDPFLQTLVDKQILPLDTALRLIAERSRLCYLPLEKYDVDLELARGFPRDICLRWCILPFDRMSKTILVATSNPFNERANYELENFNRQVSLANRFVWYLASPPELVKLLRKTFR